MTLFIMETQPNSNRRILAIAPSTRGFGFAVLEGRDSLVDWGVKSVSGDKNKKCLEKIRALIIHYQPGLVLLEDTQTVRRSVRIRTLSRQILRLVSKLDVVSQVMSRERIKQAHLADGQRTKHELAEILAKRFPEELGPRLPPKRKPWKSEDARMNIFDAVALALAHRLLNRQATDSPRKADDLSSQVLAG